MPRSDGDTPACFRPASNALTHRGVAARRVHAATSSSLFRPSFFVSCVIAAAVPACLPAQPEVPLNQPVFPTGLAIASDHLLVVSSDFDRAYADGAMLVADLDVVRAAVNTADADADVVVRDAYSVGGVLLPPFGERPVLTSRGERAYVPTRGANAIVAIAVADDGTLSCDVSTVPASCASGPRVLRLPETDPFDVVLLSERRDVSGALERVDGAVALLSSPRLTLFSDDVRRDPSLRIENTIALGSDVVGVRSLVSRPAPAGSTDVLIAGIDVNATVTGRAGSALVVVRTTPDSDIRRFDLTADLGAVSVRDMVLVTGADGPEDALLVILRGSSASGPQAIARFEIDDDASLPTLRLGALAPSCEGPTSLAVARTTHPASQEGSDNVERVLLTCHEDDAIVALDPVTLFVTDAVRFAGRGPYDIAVHPEAELAEAYVSFFSDNSIGVLSLLNEEGEPALRFRGRIGEAAPRPEDGRE